MPCKCKHRRGFGWKKPSSPDFDIVFAVIAMVTAMTLTCTAMYLIITWLLRP